jgi:hypothetical protein
VSTFGHNEIAPVVYRRKIRVRLVTSALNFSLFHYSALFLVYPISGFSLVKKGGPKAAGKIFIQ